MYLRLCVLLWTGNVGGGYDITLPDGNVEHMNTEGYYQLGVNDIPSSNINKRATIHFDPLNGDSIINKTAILNELDGQIRFGQRLTEQTGFN